MHQFEIESNLKCGLGKCSHFEIKTNNLSQINEHPFVNHQGLPDSSRMVSFQLFGGGMNKV